MAKKALIEYALNIRQSCRAFGISETCYRYEAKLSDENAEIADWLIRLTPPCVRLVVTLIKSSFIEQRAREE